MNANTAINIARRSAMKFDHTGDTREALAYLRKQVAAGNWAPHHVKNFKVGIEVLSALK